MVPPTLTGAGVSAYLYPYTLRVIVVCITGTRLSVFRSYGIPKIPLLIPKDGVRLSVRQH